jgi:predicted nucleotidyltransferase
MEKDEIIKEAVGVIRRYLPPEEFKVLLFGSWARGDAEERSDVDIGILGLRAVDDMLMLRIKGEIRAIPTLRRIDVVDLNQTDENFREEILSYAKSL